MRFKFQKRGFHFFKLFEKYYIISILNKKVKGNSVLPFTFYLLP